MCNTIREKDTILAGGGGGLALGALVACLLATQWAAAQEAGLRPGDRILPREGAVQHDFTRVTPPPGLERWERTMLEQGRRLGESMLALTPEQVRQPDARVMNMRYYDGQYVFLRIADYLEARGVEDVSEWHGYAARAREIYENFLQARRPPYRAQGYDRFAHGFFTEWRNTGDETLVEVLVKMRDVPPFSHPAAHDSTAWREQRLSREIAYALQCHILAEQAGQPRQTEHVQQLVEMALGHIDIWVNGNYINPDPDQQFASAFMTGLTATALIEYHEHTPDERILPAIRSLADWLWDNFWVENVNDSGYGAFRYRRYHDGRTSDPTGDLNLLIVPMYGWLFRETGEENYLRRGDLAFLGGTQLAWIGSGKHFNQQYRNSFDYLRWRSEGLAAGSRQ